MLPTGGLNRREDSNDLRAAMRNVSCCQQAVDNDVKTVMI